MFNAGLGLDLAQKIVDNIMTIVPYNINIMDKSGIIIASGNPDRIDSRHQGAIEALKLKKAYYIYADSETERRGINVPFCYKDEVVGVIGVSGEPSLVEPIANIVRVTAELMLEKQFYDNDAYTMELQIRDYFNELLRRPDLQKDPVFLARGTQLKIDLQPLRVVVILKMKVSSPEATDFIRAILRPGEYSIRESTLNAVVFLLAKKDTQMRIQDLVSDHPIFEGAYSGYETSDIYQSYESAEAMRAIATELRLEGSVYSIYNYVLEDLAFQIHQTDFMTTIQNRFEESTRTEGLKDTLFTFVREGFDVTKTCMRLFIHKNTFYYRIQRLSDLTGLDAKNTKNLLIIYMFLVKGWHNNGTILTKTP